MDIHGVMKIGFKGEASKALQQAFKLHRLVEIKAPEMTRLGSGGRSEISRKLSTQIYNPHVHQAVLL